MPADVPFPAWTPHSDVWLLMAAIAVGYAVAMKRLGPRLAPRGTAIVTRFQLSTFCGGLLAMWIASDWPIHDLGEQITREYAGRDLVLVSVLKGSCIFLADLMRAIDLRLRQFEPGSADFNRQIDRIDAAGNR